MIDEMPNAVLIAYVKDSDASETELELADRLETAIEEIERLVATVKQLEAVNGENAREHQT